MVKTQAAIINTKNDCITHYEAFLKLSKNKYRARTSALSTNQRLTIFKEAIREQLKELDVFIKAHMALVAITDRVKIGLKQDVQAEAELAEALSGHIHQTSEEALKDFLNGLLKSQVVDPMGIDEATEKILIAKLDEGIAKLAAEYEHLANLVEKDLPKAVIKRARVTSRKGRRGFFGPFSWLTRIAFALTLLSATATLHQNHSQEVAAIQAAERHNETTPDYIIRQIEEGNFVSMRFYYSLKIERLMIMVHTKEGKVVPIYSTKAITNKNMTVSEDLDLSNLKKLEWRGKRDILRIAKMAKEKLNTKMTIVKGSEGFFTPEVCSGSLQKYRHEQQLK